ncbi:NAD-P-binding protein [Mycena crocata]|nr:NAD-P-binding protein [Mycena crocata]
MPGNTITQDDLVDLHGKVVLLTGGNTGIGYATIKMLARRGAKVYMAARDGRRAKEAIAKMEAESLAEGSVQWLQLDLSDPRAASRAAKEFIEKESRLDILINNAALAAGPFKLNADGLLDIMVINHISHFVLTDTLLPLLKRTAADPASDVRIVNVTSMTHTGVSPDTFATKETLNKDYGPGTSGVLNTYKYSKLANILHIKALQRRLDAEGARITCLTPHPGVIRTVGSEAVVGAIPYIGWLLRRVVTPLFGSWDKGAMAVAFAAAGKEVVGPKHVEYKGAYLMPMGVITAPSSQALDVRLQEELWETTIKVVGELGL